MLNLTEADGNFGMVYAHCAEGQGGTWLIDPADVTINSNAD